MGVTLEIVSGRRCWDFEESVNIKLKCLEQTVNRRLMGSEEDVDETSMKLRKCYLKLKERGSFLVAGLEFSNIVAYRNVRSRKGTY